MRLIDADELLLKFNKVYDEADAKYHESDFDSFWGGGCSMIQEVIRETAEQPKHSRKIRLNTLLPNVSLMMMSKQSRISENNSNLTQNL